MNVIVFINNMFSLANTTLDYMFLWGGFVAFIIAYPGYFFTSNLKKYTIAHRSSELLTQTIISFLIGVGISIAWALPEIVWLGISWFRKISIINEMANWHLLAWIFSSSRWAILLIAFSAIAYLLGHEYGENRWKTSAIVHVVVIIIGWVCCFWMGIFFISIPIFAAYYGALYSFSNIIIPASNPDSRTEKKNRFFVLVSYAWGIQSPITVIDGNAWKKHEPRISGDITWEFSDFPLPFINKLKRPGVVWTSAHQVAAISGGTKFKRIDGPGMAYLGKLERSDQIFDLRLQLRTKEIEVVSKDGIRFVVRYFTAFRIDRENWSRDLYDKIRPTNPLLRGADKVSYSQGSFPFSHARVQAALGTTSTKVGEGTQLILWDQWVMNVIEDQTRKIISQKNLDEMWRPANDFQFANAMDVIANELKANSEFILRASGILLVASRVVNFKIPFTEEKGDDISKQHIESWGSTWEKKRSDILADAKAISERAQQEARAEAESHLLTSIADGLNQTQKINPELPRHVIAMRFLSSLQDYVHKEFSDEEEDGEEEIEKSGEYRKRENLSRYFQEWQNLFFASRGKEK
jgi:hypothetical protein